jgi:hypothetical protein
MKGAVIMPALVSGASIALTVRARWLIKSRRPFLE